MTAVLSLIASLLAVVVASPASAAWAVSADPFERSMSGGWGSADVGGAYLLGGAAADFSVGGGFATILSRTAGSGHDAWLPAVSLRDVEQTVKVTTGTMPNGFGQVAAVAVRRTSAGMYRVRVRFAGDRSLRLSVVRTDGGGAETLVGAEVLVSGPTFSPNTWYQLKAQTSGAGPTTLRARVWPVGGTEPAAWPLTVTDSTPALQGPGSLGVQVYVGSDATTAPAFYLEDFMTTPLTAAPAPTTATAPTRTLAGSAPIGSTGYAIPSTGAYFVAPWGSDTGTGTAASPWPTLSKAVAAAPAGATVVARGGTYHESVVFPYRKKLTLQPYPGEAVWLDGSEVVTGFAAAGVLWRRDGWDHLFDATDPTAGGGADWAMVNPAHPAAPYPDMVFYDGLPLRQVLSAAAVGPGAFYVDPVNHSLSLGSTPVGHEVRAATLAEALYVNQGAGSVVRGIGIQRYATPLSRFGAVKMFADDSLLENVVVRSTATRGVGLSGARITVRSVTVTGSGQLGIGATQSDNLTVANSLITGNNNEHFNPTPLAGGIKVTSSRFGTYRGNVVSNNAAAGLWLDESCYGTTIVGNVVQANAEHGIHVEISGNTTVADNLVTDNGGSGLRLAEANDVRVWNNTLARNLADIDPIDSPRVASDPTTPGHDPRYPNDPGVTWQLRNVVLRNNLLMDARPGAISLLGVDDGTRTMRGSDMVSTDYSAFYRASSTAPGWLVNWANYGGSPSMYVFTTLDAFRQTTGQEAHGFEVRDAANPFVVDEAGGNYSVTVSSPAKGRGLPLPTDIATVIGVPAGGPTDIGRLA